jgi:hypothetical protein
MIKSANTRRIVRLAEQLADRFERIGLDEKGNMDNADKRLLNRMRIALEQYRADHPSRKLKEPK